ncbi:MAG: hypothetical protein IKE55_06685 [Kiritimatiellae bacterium]|nr:hypothetical protein [Kiritimatiellia bacterium]
MVKSKSAGNRSGAFFVAKAASAMASAALAFCANAYTTFYWHGTADNPVWDLTMANWRLAGASSDSAYHNNNSDTIANFSSGYATDVSVDAGGVSALVLQLQSGDYVFGGGPITATYVDPLGGNPVIRNTVNCSSGIRLQGGTLTIGDGGYLDGPYQPWNDYTPESKVVVLTNGTLRTGFDKTKISNYTSTLYFNGGALLHTYDSYQNRVTFGKSKLVLGAGGMHVKERVANGWSYLPAPIGTDADLPTDGGLIVDDLSADTYLYMQKNASNAFRGGLHVAGTGGSVGIDGDSALGAVPSEPMDNIFFECPSNTVSSKFISHGDVTVNANRNIRIGNGVSAQIGTYADNSPLTVKGTISCENLEHGFLLTRAHSSGATVTLDPGSGRTNHVSRLSVGMPTVLASGTTLLYSTKGLNQSSDEKYGTNDGSPLHVGSTLTVKSGAELRTVAGSRIVTQNGRLIVDGGLVDCDGHEMLHANVGAATTTVRNGGRLYLQNVRIGGNGAGSDASRSVFNIETGGVVRLKGSLYIHGNQPSFMATVNFNGGAIEWAKPEVPGNQFANCPFGSDNAATMNNVAYNVLKGGMNITNDLQMWFYPLITSGVADGETDGGLTKWGRHTLAIMRQGHTFNGPLTVMQGTVSIGMVEAIPATTTIRVNAGASFSLNTYSQTFARIEGSGRYGGFLSSSVLSVTSAIAPGMSADSPGTLTIADGGTINIADGVALEIDVDDDGNSDCFSCPARLDLSKMSLHVNDLSKLNAEKKYTIASLPQGCSGAFASTNLVGDWAVRYYESTHELKMVCVKGTRIVLR